MSEDENTEELDKKLNEEMEVYQADKLLRNVMPKEAFY